MKTEMAATVRVSRRFDASAERVFDAWLDPAAAARFLFATGAGRMVRADIDARVGGSYCFVDGRDGEDVEHRGRYLEIDRPRRLVFTFVVPTYSTVETRVTVEIEPPDTGCELTLTHQGVLPEYESRTESGWVAILEGLAAVVGRKVVAVSFLRLVASGKIRGHIARMSGLDFGITTPSFEAAPTPCERQWRKTRRRTQQGPESPARSGRRSFRRRAFPRAAEPRR